MAPNARAKYLPRNSPPDPSKPKRNFKSRVQKGKEESHVEIEDKREDVPLPPRPSRGSAAGTSIELETNYFKITTTGLDLLYLYGVSFSPGHEPGSRRRERRVLQLMLDGYDTLSSAATDYRHLLVSIRPITENESSTALPIDYYEVGDRVPQPSDAERDTCWVQIDYQKSISVARLNSYLRNAANSNPYPEKEETINALNVLLGRDPNQANHIQEMSKNKIFDTSTRQRTGLRGGLNAYVGFYKSTRTSTAGLLLNVNALTSGFYNEGLVNVLIDEWSAFWSGTNDRARQLQYENTNVAVLERFLKGLRVRATYGPRRFHTIWAIPRLENQQRPLPAIITFGLRQKEIDGSFANPVQTAVSQYFHLHYRDAVVQQDAIVVDVGSDQHPVYIPSNLLRVLPGNRYRHAMVGEQQTSMIRTACRPASIDKHNNPSNKTLIRATGLPLLNIITPPPPSGPERRFGIRVDGNMLSMFGNMISAPQLQYRTPVRGKPTSYALFSAVSQGSWLLRDLLFSKPCGEVKWSWLELSAPVARCNAVQRDNFLRELGQQLKQQCSINPHFWRFNPDDPNQSEHFFDSSRPKSAASLKTRLANFKKYKVELLFVILPTKDTGKYAMLKKVADVDVGIHTSCIVKCQDWSPGKKNARNGRLIPQINSDPGSIVNTLHKVNLRLRGTNLILDSHSNGEGQLFTRETMILGADVTHPGGGSMRECPSVAAVVGSLESEFNLYGASIRCQTGKMERIEAFGAMVGERLDHWMKENASKYAASRPQYPKQIVIFRDGVSESQFQMILQDEWPQIQTTIRQKYGANNHQPPPKVLLMCVLKRHSTRFFPTRQADHDGNGNPHCGLVVDDHVTYPHAYDFYLQSHKCIQGTARPAHYVVLLDQLHLPAAVVQMETYEHCFLYGRCSKAIGIHPAARYADRACERGRHYLYDAFVAGNRVNQVFDFNTAGWMAGVHADLAGSMFFI